MDWTGKVDGKATFVLGLVTAAVTAFVTLSADLLPPDGCAPEARLPCFWAAVGLLLSSAAVSLCVVLPQLDHSVTRTRWRSGFVYFGHLRHWDPDDLTQALLTREPLPVLSQQIVDMSRICYRKYRLVQVSIVLASVGTVIATVSLFLG
ncbi:Pycsar system effector family protein [Streptomyces luridiscabiei]|uniref:Pycsar system effector family protein n=1 Tax=Streptomyces luridiscabiei TaxID=164114 RepID=UPI0018FE5A7C|nr:Pycsar system effector family protein [Streptomyces luridiscabiei]